MDKLPAVPIAIEHFETLSEQFRPLTQKIVYSVHRTYYDCVEIEDLEQEAALAMFTAIKTYDPQREAYFFLWLKRIVLNRLLDYTKRYVPGYLQKDESGKYRRIRSSVESLDQRNATS